MKCDLCDRIYLCNRSRPSRGAWIEIVKRCLALERFSVSRPSRGAWIEMNEDTKYNSTETKSRPSRGAWIEIS